MIILDKKTPLISVFLCLSLLIIFQESPAQEYYSIPLGIPAKESSKRTTITSIEKDETGYIWIGTDMGLLRYNGTNYKRFQHTGTRSIASDCILSLRNDTDGRLWAATDLGLSLIQRGEFSRNIPLDVGRINGIVNLGEAELVISAEEGLFILNKSTGSIIKEVKDKDLANSRNMTMGMDMICVIADSPANAITILDRDLRLVGKQVFNSTSINSASSYMGEFYIGTSSGLKKLSTDCRDIPLPEALQPFKDRDVLFTAADDYKGELLIGVKEIGIFRFNGRNDTVTKVWQSETLSGVSSCTCIALRNNIALCKNRRAFSVSKEVETETMIIPGLETTEYIRNVFPSAHNNNALIITDRGIYLFNILTRETKNITDVVFPDNSSCINSLLDKDLNLWTVNRDGILTKYLYIKDERGNIRYAPGKVFSGDYNNSKLFASGDSPVGIVTPRRITLFDQDDNSMSENLTEGYSHNPYTDANGKLYLYGKEGIFAMSDSTGGRKIPLDVEAECLAVDNYGHIWAGTDNDGIYIYSPESGNIDHYGKEDGLPENSIRSLILFRDRMWICCRHSIAYCRLNSGRISIPTGGSDLIMNYSKNSGTVSDIIGLGNRIIFAGNHELTICNPFDTPARKEILMSIDRVSSLNMELPTDGKMFTLSNNNNNLLFLFSAINYDSAEYFNYEYMLEGHDQDWIKAGSTNQVTYNDLEGGEYVFRARVQTSSGEHSNSEISIPFKIKKTLSDHWWFRIILLAFALSFILYFTWLFFNNNLMDDVIKVTKATYENLETEMKRMILHSRQFADDLNIITALYSPVRELEEDKDLKSDSRKLVNSISRGIDSLTRHIVSLSEQVTDSIEWHDTQLSVENTDLKSVVSKATEAAKTLTDATKSVVLNEAGNENGFFDVVILSKMVSLSIVHMIEEYGPSKEIRITAENLESENVMSIYGFSIPGYSGPYTKILILSYGKYESIKEDALYRKYSKLKKEGAFTDQKTEMLELLCSISQNHKGMVTETKDGLIYIIPSGKEAYGKEEFRFNASDENDFGPIVPDNRINTIIAQFPEKRTVLIAENDKILRDLIADLFRPVATLVLATNGVDAYDLFEENDIDLSILDTSLPSMDGYSLCSKIKHSPKDNATPVILISSDKDIVSSLKANDAGADAFIQKPFHKEILLARGSALIRNYEKIASSAIAPENSQPIPFRNPRKASESDRVFISKVSEIIEANLSDENFTVNALVEEMGTSYSQFFSRVKKITGHSPKDLLLSLRLEKAKNLLKGGENNISEIAYMVGFSSLSSFSRAFKNKFGAKPSSF